MSGEDALSEAIEELYSVDPEAFIKRRGALVSQARHDGDAETASAITALRRPTKAAWIINRLVRSDPEVASGLAELGRKLRDAQRSLDGTRLRQLTQQRRKLIDSATRQAFDIGGRAESVAALRHEVASTLEAALADPDVAEQLGTGTLVRSAEWSGFGDSAPTLSAVPPLRPEGRRAKSSTKRAAATKPSGKASAASRPATPTEVTGEKRRQERITQAEEALEAATSELAAAAAAERGHDDNVRLLMEQLADARRRQDEAGLGTRHAKARQRDAQRRLDRVRK